MPPSGVSEDSSEDQPSNSSFFGLLFGCIFAIPLSILSIILHIVDPIFCWLLNTLPVLAGAGIDKDLPVPRRVHVHLRHVRDGMSMAMRGIGRGWKNQEVRRSIRQGVFWLILTCFVLVSAVLAVVLPFWALVRAMQWVISCILSLFWSEGAGMVQNGGIEHRSGFLLLLSPSYMSSVLTTILYHVLLTWTPSIVLFIYTQIMGWENVFLQTLQTCPGTNQRHANHAVVHTHDVLPSSSASTAILSLQHHPRPSRVILACRYIRRAVPLMVAGSFIFLIQQVPFLARYTPSITLVKVAQRLGTLSKAGSIKSKILLAIALVLVIRSNDIQQACYWIFHLYLYTMAIARELLDTYLCRLDYRRGKTHKSQRREVRTDDQQSSPPPVTTHQHADPTAMTRRRTAGASSPTLASTSSSPSSSTGIPPLPHTSSRHFLRLHSGHIFGFGLTFVLLGMLFTNLHRLFGPAPTLPTRIAAAAAGSWMSLESIQHDSGITRWMSIIQLLMAPLAHAAAASALHEMIASEAKEARMERMQHDKQLRKSTNQQPARRRTPQKVTHASVSSSYSMASTASSSSDIALASSAFVASSSTSYYASTASSASTPSSSASCSSTPSASPLSPDDIDESPFVHVQHHDADYS